MNHLPIPAFIKASAPGRICLFGEHQDYLGLSVITAAIDLRIQVTGQAVPARRFTIHCPDIDEMDVNPLLAFPGSHSCVGLDARIKITP